VGSDAAGKQLCEAMITTAGAPVGIKLTPHTGPAGWRADGADLALVDVEVVDAKGNRCPTALNPIKFDLQGVAEWRGGIAVGADNFILSKELPVEGGINRVILRSQPQAGKIVLSASADGLKPARVELASIPFATTDGDSKTLPNVGLTPRLDRGPTPAGDSAVPTRKAVRIASATAGANAEEIGKAFDDNEATKWKNDGKRATAWIQFELERSANVSEITLKLGGWRTNSYPLRVTVDGKGAYRDSRSRCSQAGSVTCVLRSTLDPQLYDVPLTIVIDVNGARSARADRAGRQLPVRVGNGSIYVQAAPGVQPITITWE
jgi:hypothetical protein